MIHSPCRTAAFTVIYLAFAIILTLIVTAGCGASATRSVYLDNGAARRNPEAAADLHARASKILPRDSESAERLLREALAADLYHGPAHNNLGILLLKRGDLYAAANEFEWARKLMPGHPDPRVNLAMTLERAGQVDGALKNYDSALAVWPHYLPALKGKVRLQLASDRIDETTRPNLERIALQAGEEWRDWAMKKLALIP